MTQRTELEIPATDGFPLHAVVVATHSGGEDWLVVNPAFAVGCRFYSTFAEAVALAGCTAVTFDYRGIGGSRPDTLRGFAATMLDWATRDMAGVLEWVHRTQAPRHVLMVGHSLGGILPGMIPDPRLVHAMVTVGSENVYWRYRAGVGRARALLQSRLTRPIVASFGYLPWSRFSSAEDVPAGAIQQMADAVRRPGGLLDDPTLPAARFADFTAPVLAYSIADDPEATKRSVDLMMEAYPHVERRHLDAADAGLDHLGHFGYFQRPARDLWPEAISWLRSNAEQTPSPR